MDYVTANKNGFYIYQYLNGKCISWRVNVQLPNHEVGQPNIFEKHRDLERVICDIFEYFLLNENYKKYNLNSICDKYKEYNNKILRIKHVNTTVLRNISCCILRSLLNILKGIEKNYCVKETYKDTARVKLVQKGLIVYDGEQRKGHYGDNFIFLPYDLYELIKGHIGLKNVLIWADTNIILKMKSLGYYRIDVLVKILNSLIKRCKLDEDIENFLIFTINKQITDIRFEMFSSDLPFQNIYFPHSQINNLQGVVLWSELHSHRGQAISSMRVTR